MTLQEICERLNQTSLGDDLAMMNLLDAGLREVDRRLVKLEQEATFPLIHVGVDRPLTEATVSLPMETFTRLQADAELGRLVHNMPEGYWLIHDEEWRVFESFSLRARGSTPEEVLRIALGEKEEENE